MHTGDAGEAEIHFLEADEYDWKQPEAVELHSTLTNAYSDLSRARLLLRKAGFDVRSVREEQAIRGFWTDVIDEAFKSSQLRTVVKKALEDPSVARYHERWIRLLGPEPRPKKPTILPWTGPEIITGAQRTFLDMSFVHEALRMSASVVRLVTRTVSGQQFYGTGFLIADDTILSNHHVLFDAEGRPVEQVDVQFNYELDGSRRPKVVDQREGNVERIQGNPALDWAIVPLRSPLLGYPLFDLVPSRPVTERDFVFIIQHPHGELKQIGLLHNQVVNVTDTYVQYLTDTLPGSSGAPVCNEHWQVVALHHQGVEAPAGSTQSNRNQGIRIDRVRGDLVARGILGNEKR